MRITYAGHATVVLEADGTRLVTDPLLRPRIGHLRRYVAPVAVTCPDAVLVSHFHHDHLDIASIRALDRPRLVGPPGLRRLVGRLSDDIVELVPGAAVSVGALAVTATPAEHDGRRLPFQPATTPLGFVVQSATARVYFAGDTDLFDGMAEIDDDLDVALVPIAGWGSKVGPGHLDPERAARALTLLRPRVAVPIHWGAYASPRARPRDPWEPVRRFQRFAEVSAPGVEIRVLSPGEHTDA